MKTDDKVMQIQSLDTVSPAQLNDLTLVNSSPSSITRYQNEHKTKMCAIGFLLKRSTRKWRKVFPIIKMILMFSHCLFLQDHIAALEKGCAVATNISYFCYNKSTGDRRYIYQLSRVSRLWDINDNWYWQNTNWQNISSTPGFKVW